MQDEQLNQTKISVNTADTTLPPIPDRRYFTIGETGELCGVKPHVLRYWEQEFPRLKPSKRRGNRRYYQYKDVLMIRKIRDLLYTQGFTIEGARQKLAAEEQSLASSVPVVAAPPLLAPTEARLSPLILEQIRQAITELQDALDMLKT